MPAETLGKGARPARPRVCRLALQPLRTVDRCLCPHFSATTSGCTARRCPGASAVDVARPGRSTVFMSTTAVSEGSRPGQALLIRDLLHRVRSWAPAATVTYRDRLTLTYREWLGRTARLGAWLRELNIQPGDRVGVMDWDSHRTLELFFAVPMSGAALHTINIKLTPEQIAYTIAHARDSILFIHADFLPILAAIRAQLPALRHVIVMSDDDAIHADEYEPGLKGRAPVDEWPDLDENMTATLFYTTGTTGEPKGVSFSHRQIVLHTLTAGLTLAVHDEPLNLRASDVYMPLTPMFHVHAWGLPYLATTLGMTQVYPGRYEPEMLLRLLESHRVTFSHCVPTLLLMLLRHPAAGAVDWFRFKVVIGGAALLPAVANEARSRGIRIVGGYGMSETCPIVAVSHVTPALAAEHGSAPVDVITRTGFPLPLVQARVVDAEGRPVPPGSDGVGELVLRCPWLTRDYLEDPVASDRLWRDGWLHTGDGARIDSDGYIRITDRLKDVIKVGGEWISSIEIESVFARHPAVAEVAVIGVPDSKWDEHPRAEIVVRPDAGPVSPRDLLRHLRDAIDTGLLHKRALITEIVIVPAIPKTSVGKTDKKRMRALLVVPRPA